MFTAGRRLLLDKPKILWAALGLLSLGAIAVFFAWPSSDIDRDGDLVVSLPLPVRPPDPGQPLREAFIPDTSTTAVEGAPANPAFTQPELDPLKPNEPDLDLVDASPFGPLPRIADDGRAPVQNYARPYDRSDERPKVAILVTGLGPQADATNASFHLPGAISLMFSPYTEDLPTYFERARLAGHEVLIELPMEPADYPSSDPGPHTLRASGTVDANIERLNWVLSRAPGFFAVAGQGGVFADSPEAAPMMKALADKGIGMIEIDGDGLADDGAASGLAYLSAPNWIDATPSAEAIDQELADLETRARLNGMALGIAEAYPVTLRRLVDWSAGLEQRGIALVPVSAMLLANNGPDDDQASNLAQTRN